MYFGHMDTTTTTPTIEGYPFVLRVEREKERKKKKKKRTLNPIYLTKGQFLRIN